MRVAIVGYGIQGRKRKNLLTGHSIIVVDPVSEEADFIKIQDVPLKEFDAAFVCTPDSEKYQIIDYLVDNKKHVLCEKPLIFPRLENFHHIQNKAIKNGTLVYTAYNHRFETSIVRANQLIASGFLGKIYMIRLFYGNGTAKLVANSSWRDSGLGVITDLGPHCIDIIRYMLPEHQFSFELSEAWRLENRAPDYALLISKESFPKIIIEISLCSWKNQFEVEIVGEKGALNIDGLRKWGPARLVTSHRVFPSGYPNEIIEDFQSGDETWTLEHDHFIELISQRIPTDLENDIFIFNKLNETPTN